MTIMASVFSSFEYFLLFIIYMWINQECNGLSHCSQDPCHGYIMILSNGSRTENCPDVQYSNCDAYISSGWYRTDIPMLNHCPTSGLGFSCGTTFPAWMNGTSPTVSDGIVNRDVCLKGPTSCCVKIYAIQVKNCSNFMAYCLRPLGSCPERYCFGTFGSCLSTTIATTTTHISATSQSKTELHVTSLETHRNASYEGSSNTDITGSYNDKLILGIIGAILVIAVPVIIIIIINLLRQIKISEHENGFTNTPVHNINTNKK